MPDITMCTNHTCHLRESCYRYRAVPNNENQSFFYANPRKKDGYCQHHWPTTYWINRAPIRNLGECDAVNMTDPMFEIEEQYKEKKSEKPKLIPTTPLQHSQIEKERLA